MRYDVVVWGATGFTGALVAETLARCADPGLTWAIAGRNADKLAALARRVGNPPVLLGDAADQAQMRALARQAKVVCTTVGPYAQYGEPLVDACVEEGTHYCDLTGEPQFVRRMIDRHHARAQERGLRIVHCCGFDSVPSDLGAFLVEERAIEALGRPLPDVRLYVRRAKGGFSGGTLASAMGIADELAAARSQGDDRVRRVLGDPYALLPEDAPRGPRVRDQRGVRWDDREGLWTAPFLMAGINGKIVRRTNGLLGLRYGADFAYEEVSGYRRLLPAVGMTVGLGASVVAIGARPLRGLVKRWLPAPGEGPSAEARAHGYFTIDVVGRGEGAEVRVRIEGDQDPGYGSTSGMLAQAAMCLARDTLAERYGVLTPAAAMGHALVARLPRAGVTFAVSGP